MNVRFPPSFIEEWRKPGIRKAFVNEPYPAVGDACSNCGGAGIMWMFLAFDGPYKSASSDTSRASHFADGKWWIGASYTDKCPVCKGNGENHG